MKRMTFFSTSARRCLAAAVLLFVALLPIIAGNYYYYGKATVSETGAGLVYINDETTQVQNRNYQSESEIDENSGDKSITFYLYAKASPGYQFGKWQLNTSTGWTDISSKPDETHKITINNRGESNKQSYYFQAVFTKQEGVVQAMVAGGQDSRGSVSIDPSTNHIGDKVTLTATPSPGSGIRFRGWYKDGALESNVNPYTFTIDGSNMGTYYAYFSEEPENVYCRIRNKATGRFLTLCGKKKATTTQDGFIFEKSLKLIDDSDAKGNPMTVFQRLGFPVQNNQSKIGEADLVANDIHYHNLVTDNATSYDYELTMEETSNGVRIYTTFNSSTTYLTDEENGDWAVMQADASKNIYWDVYLLDESTTTGSFGANAKADFSGEGNYGESGKYYTTMYTYFPYKLTNGVKAYYLPLAEESYDEEGKIVSFTEVTGGIVPKNSAVVLECSGIYDGTNNILIPQKNDPSETFQSRNVLAGYISLYDENGGGPNVVVNDKTNMYILSKKGSELGWYLFTAPNMTPNKAFLNLSGLEHLLEQNNINVREVKFSFGRDDEATGIISKRFADDVDCQLFDLNGRRVNGNAYGLKKGIYISNGKKIVVK